MNLLERSKSTDWSRGVIYYNIGNGALVRLLVSIHSLRQFYSGPITILSEGEDSHLICKSIAEVYRADLIEWNCGISVGANRTYLAKTRYVHGSPYEITLALDSDTLVMGEVAEIFDLARDHEFCVAKFSNWRTESGAIKRRILQWHEIYPEQMAGALEFGPAINCGVVAFKKNSSFYNNWEALALPGRDLFIPDEVSCQIHISRYPHKIIDRIWNCSCKYDHPRDSDIRIIHYHGRKHYRPGLPYHGDLWFSIFENLLEDNAAGLRSWVEKGDRNLVKYGRNPKKRDDVCESSDKRFHPTFPGPDEELKIILGARRTKYEGWISTDKNILDVTNGDDWASYFGDRRAAALLAEHVWEHLDPSQIIGSNRLAFQYLKSGGFFRLAVPDGNHPDKSYVNQVRPGGTGKSAFDHKSLFNYRSLAQTLNEAGFKVEFLEYWDEHGIFHYKPWQSRDGFIKRSLLNDRRNRKGALLYSSLILDAYKP